MRTAKGPERWEGVARCVVVRVKESERRRAGRSPGRRTVSLSAVGEGASGVEEEEAVADLAERAAN